MFIVVNKKRYASKDADMLLQRMRSLFPKYRMFIAIDSDKEVEIFGEQQLVLATRLVARASEHETETECMERKARLHMLAPSSEDEPDTCSENDMTEEFFETIGFKHEHL